jgi:type IV secretion system protein VirD4
MFSAQKLHGEARWARFGEVKGANLLDDAGIILGRFGQKFLRFGGTEHVMLEAPTRAGKGVGVVIPNLLQWPDSVVVLDVKQENWDLTAGFRSKQLGRNHPLQPARRGRRTCRYNPLQAYRPPRSRRCHQ